MEGIGSAKPPLADRTPKDGVVGRMEHAVAEAREDGQNQKHPIGVDEAHEEDRYGNQAEPGE